MYPQFIIHVNFYGVLREITGKKSDEIQLESSSLGDLLGALAKKYGDPFESYFFTSKTLSPQVNIFLNHTVIQLEKIAEITLHHRDQLDLFAPVSGG